MRVLIVSDNHGDEQTLSRVVRRQEVDHVLHCGDFCTNVDALPLRERMTVVRGNCDYTNVPEEATWEGGGFRFLVTHGHHYQIKSSLNNLFYRAEEVNADIVCFGHSHDPYCDIHGGSLFLNPGSIVLPRGYPLPTYAVLEKVANDSIQVTYYTPEGDVVAELGGSYCLPAG